jgi:hypothetical protein
MSLLYRNLFTITEIFSPLLKPRLDDFNGWDARDTNGATANQATLSLSMPPKRLCLRLTWPNFYSSKPILERSQTPRSLLWI